ncbi:MAG: hypothetical protein HYU56_02930 [Candidatus Aenigmarchaeota archaeon]|nr:hypothetical protein [Candidatus Aenigmarchaeota archaeon]
MFSGIRKIFSSSEQSELKLEEARDFIKINMGKEALLAREKLKAELEKVLKDYATLRKMYADLGSQETKADYPNSVKSKLCSRAMEMLTVPEPEIDHDNIVNFIRMSEERIRGIGAIGYKELIHLYAFKDDMQKISNQTKILINSLNSLAEELDKSVVRQISITEQCILRIENSKRLQRELEYSIESKEESIKEKKKLLESSVKALKEFAAIEEEVADLSREILNAETEMRFLDSKISEEFSGTEKIFKKYRHMSKEKGVISEYIKNPTNAFIDIDKDLEIKDILDTIFDERKEFEDDKKFEKAMQLRRDMGLLTSLREQHAAHRQNKMELQEKTLKLSAEASDKRYKLQEIEDIENEIKSVETERASNEEKIKHIGNSVRNDMQQLSILLRELTRKNVIIAG